MKLRIFKDYPERVLGALALFVVGVVVIVALLVGVLDTRVVPAENSLPEGKDSIVFNINTASEEELKQLDGISDVLAKRIVSYREENGDFESVDDLANVHGIGEKKLKDIRNYVVAE